MVSICYHCETILYRGCFEAAHPKLNGAAFSRLNCWKHPELCKTWVRLLCCTDSRVQDSEDSHYSSQSKQNPLIDGEAKFHRAALIHRHSFAKICCQERKDHSE